MTFGVLKHATTIFVPTEGANVSQKNPNKFHTHRQKANLNKSYVNMEQEVLGRICDPYVPSDAYLFIANSEQLCKSFIHFYTQFPPAQRICHTNPQSSVLLLSLYYPSQHNNYLNLIHVACVKWVYWWYSLLHDSAHRAIIGQYALIIISQTIELHSM
jgi:hypothetical protein